MQARLMLENGQVFTGRLIGVPGTTYGEIVFNTAHTGYQEILSDPSYKGQIVVMTYPEIGNYGINTDDLESTDVHAAAFVVRRLSPVTSNWRATGSLPDLFKEKQITGIEAVDTRAITRIVRQYGAMKAGVTTEDISDDEFLAKIKSQPTLDEQNLVEQVTTKAQYTLQTTDPGQTLLNRLVVVDFGVKKSILTYLQALVDELVVVPASTTLQQIQVLKPQGVLLSNGPGDPRILTEAVQLAKDLINADMPTFGICLGHQILSLACGADVEKMPFGHHGANHPVKDMEADKINITSQNHGYAVSPNNFPASVVKVTHINLNDNTIAGIRHVTKPVASVQFHPEASPGPHDSNYLFKQFVEEMVEQQPAVF